MTIPGSLPLTLIIPQRLPSVATKPAAAGLSSQASDTSRSYKFTQQYGAAPSRISPRPIQHAREFPLSLRSYPSPVKRQAPPKLSSHSAPAGPAAKGVVSPSVKPPTTSALSKSGKRAAKPAATSGPSTPVKQAAASVLAAPVRAAAKPVLSTRIRQTATRTLYSREDAQRDLSSLTSSEKLLKISIQCNRKRLPESQTEIMEDTGKDIKTLMQAIKKTDPTSPATSKFRKQTNELKSRVENHLRDISMSYVRRMPPRPAATKPPSPQTVVASDRQKKHAARREQFAIFRQEKRQAFAASGASREIHAEWNCIYLSQEDAEDNVNKSILTGARDPLDNGEPRKIPSAGEESRPDFGYVSQNASVEASPPISPTLEKHVSLPVGSSGDKHLSQEKPPTGPCLRKGQTSSPFRSLPRPHSYLDGFLRVALPDIPTRTTSPANGSKEV
jgi:hypothetical protein